MGAHIRVGAFTLIVAGLLPAAMLAAPDPEPEVPVGHWAYDAVTTLAKYGVSTGRPDGWYKGKRPVSRRDFTETLCYILGEGERLEGEGAFWSPQRKDLQLDRLVDEFRGDLMARGAERSDIASGLARLGRIWKDPRPHGVTAPLPGSRGRPLFANWPENAAARNEGSREAEKAWGAGQVVLYSIAYEKPLSPEPVLERAITLKPVSDPADRHAVQKALGHNAAMWKLLREKGPPDDVRYGWLRRVFDLKRLAARQKALKLATEGVTSSEGAFLIKPRHYLHGYALEANGRDLLVEFVETPFGDMRDYRVRWGEAGTGVARFDVDFESGRRTYAVDCRTGCVLNAR